MLEYIERTDKKFNKTFKDYFIKQGDTFGLTATLEEISNGATGTSVNTESVEKFVFELLKQVTDCELEQVFTKDYILIDDVWVLDVRSNETALWEKTCELDDIPYKYRIKVIYVDGDAIEVTTANFTVES